MAFEVIFQDSTPFISVDRGLGFITLQRDKPAHNISASRRTSRSRHVQNFKLLYVPPPTTRINIPPPPSLLESSHVCLIPTPKSQPHSNSLAARQSKHCSCLPIRHLFLLAFHSRPLSSSSYGIDISTVVVPIMSTLLPHSVPETLLTYSIPPLSSSRSKLVRCSVVVFPMLTLRVTDSSLERPHDVHV